MCNLPNFAFDGNSNEDPYSHLGTSCSNEYLEDVSSNKYLEDVSSNEYLEDVCVHNHI